MFTEDQRIDFAGLYIETRYEMRDKILHNRGDWKMNNI